MPTLRFDINHNSTQSVAETSPDCKVTVISSGEDTKDDTVDLFNEETSGIDGASNPEDRTTDPDAGGLFSAWPGIARIIDGKGGGKVTIEIASAKKPEASTALLVGVV